MDELKTQMIQDAKIKMQEAKKRISKQKADKLRAVKNTYERPGGDGGNSLLGENFNDFMNNSNSPTKPKREARYGSISPARGLTDEDINLTNKRKDIGKQLIQKARREQPQTVRISSLHQSNKKGFKKSIAFDFSEIDENDELNRQNSK